MVRNAGKFGKAKRGGGRHFTPARVLSGKDENGTEASMWRDSDDESSEEDADEDEESEESDSDSSDEQPAPTRMEPSASKPPSTSPATKTRDRKARVAEKGKNVGFKAAESDDEDQHADLIPKVSNRDANKAQKLSSLAAQPQEMTRKEREAAEKKAAQERYRKLHEAGKTDEARADLARLAKVRKEREEAAKRKEAENAEKAKQKAVVIENSGRKKTR